MEKFIVKEKVQLNGFIETHGAKNAALPIMAAAILARGVCTIDAVPALSDVRLMAEILESLGAKTQMQGNKLEIDAAMVKTTLIPHQLMSKMRASLCLVGALVGRFHTVELSLPGGCDIGARPIDLHIRALKKMGAQAFFDGNIIRLSASRLKGTRIVLDYPSVGATENIMLAAVLAEGATCIEHAACEPEIADLACFLNKMGAKISGAGSPTIYIEGVNRVYGTEYKIMPDRIQAGTLLLAGVITGGNITVGNISSNYLPAFLDVLPSLGASISLGNDFIKVRKSGGIRPVYVETRPFPGFPTDLQAPLVATLALSDGTSRVTETVFENRFQYVEQLRGMGAQIETVGRCATVKGMKALRGAALEAPDLRAGGALILAALAAEGESIIKNIFYIDRGYACIEKQLQSLGAKILRVV